ncbi:MAG: acyl-CoA thioesterase [Planctomycetes bacterium]|nr:acyl-CoA thioesterase [Planctomycetota bacterium]NUQ35363.1 acyl-CoA thioesterase [Planctomycetaceae bacterium]
MAYSNTYAIRFNDVDHARILYYPTFLHYFHCCFEDFFEHAVGFHYKRVLTEHRVGFPVVHLDVDFKSPLRFGDHVQFTLNVERIGTKSVTFHYVGKRVETEVQCVEASITTAVMNMDTYQAIELPSQYREWFTKHLAK